MTFLGNSFTIFQENLVFLAIATSFFVVIGWAWRQTKPYDLPQPLPAWFKIWFLSVQIGGIVLPLAAMLVWWSNTRVLTVLLSYFLMLGLQILSESISLRWFHSVVFVMVPYLYIPYRIWQLYEGLTLFSPDRELVWVRNLLFAEIILWTLNYALDLSQLPRLLHWEMNQEAATQSVTEKTLNLIDTKQN